MPSVPQPTPQAQQPQQRSRGSGRCAGAGHVLQPGDRVHDRAGRAGPGHGARAGQRGHRAHHRGRAAAWRADRRVAPAARPVVLPPEVRPAVRGPLLHDRAARDRAGHPPVPGVRPDQGHRPGDGRADGGPLRRRHHARHRRRARPPGRGSRPRPEAQRADQGRVGRAEGHQGGNDLPAGRRRLHVAGGEDLQEVRRRVDRHRQAAALPAGRGHLGHRLQDRRHDRRLGRHREGQPRADQGRPRLYPVRGRRRRPLLPPRAPARHRGRQDPGRRRRTSSRRSIADLAAEELAVRDEVPVPGAAGAGPVQAVYLPPFYHSERSLAAALRRLSPPARTAWQRSRPWTGTRPSAG